MSLLLLYTADEHGWMEGTGSGPGSGSGGAADLLARWRAVEGLSAETPALILSGGDLWTGPALSTWTQGRNMVAVLNRLGVDAAALGNHEFDFGLEVLAQRIEEMDFPLLAANLVRRSDGAYPSELGVEPWTLLEVAGLRVGVVGLASRSTPRTTFPPHVASLAFTPYEAALRRATLELRAAGAEVVLLVSHLCRAELEELARATRDLEIAFMGAGHCNERFASTVGETVLVGPGAHLEHYARGLLRVEAGVARVEGLEVRANPASEAPEPGLAAWIASARAELAASLGEELVVAREPLERHDPRLRALVPETWLLAWPGAQVALMNRGGLRAGLPAGSITLGDAVSVLPFENTLVLLELPGHALKELCRTRSFLLPAGLLRRDGEWWLPHEGRRLDDDERVRVLTTDFLYEGGDGLDVLAELDPEPLRTAMHWRRPLELWLAEVGARGESLEEGLEALLGARGGG